MLLRLSSMWPSRLHHLCRRIHSITPCHCPANLSLITCQACTRSCLWHPPRVVSLSRAPIIVFSSSTPSRAITLSCPPARLRRPPLQHHGPLQLSQRHCRLRLLPPRRLRLPPLLPLSPPHLLPHLPPPPLSSPPLHLNSLYQRPHMFTTRLLSRPVPLLSPLPPPPHLASLHPTSPLTPRIPAPLLPRHRPSTLDLHIIRLVRSSSRSLSKANSLLRPRRHPRSPPPRPPLSPPRPPSALPPAFRGPPKTNMLSRRRRSHRRNRITPSLTKHCKPPSNCGPLHKHSGSRRRHRPSDPRPPWISSSNSWSSERRSELASDATVLRWSRPRSVRRVWTSSDAIEADEPRCLPRSWRCCAPRSENASGSSEHVRLPSRGNDA
mmetsp:Transcript_23580/g.59036  ORF Transcript_23580/g.59036 Transcript_23580/m.59036 type:complete len:380 (-) Transcript_23580:404-1543(-)